MEKVKALAELVPVSFPSNLKYRAAYREHYFYFDFLADHFSSAAIVEVQNVLDPKKETGIAASIKAHVTYFSQEGVIANAPHALWVRGPIEWEKLVSIPPGDVGRIAVAFPRISAEGQEWIAAPEDVASLRECKRIEIKILEQGKSCPLLALVLAFDPSDFDGCGLTLLSEA
jgi:hypothetical protein